MKLLKLLVPIFLLVGVFFAVGPRVELDTSIQPVQLPSSQNLEALDAYLAESESQFPDLKLDTERTIIWVNPEQKDETPVSFVYIHGFSATRQEVAPLPDQVATQLGGNLFYTRLTGHGRSDDAMAEPTVNAWINDTIEAIAIGEAIGEQVVIIATSTGGSLVAWMAANGHLNDDVSAMILLSPNFGPANAASEALLWPWGKQIAQIAEGPYREWEPYNEKHAEFWTYRYPSQALLPMMGIVKLARDSDLQAVQQPLLVLYSKEDSVVSWEKTEAVFETLGSERKELVAVTTEHKDGHVLAGDVLSPSTTEPIARQIVEFLIPILDGPE